MFHVIRTKRQRIFPLFSLAFYKNNIKHLCFRSSALPQYFSTSYEYLMKYYYYLQYYLTIKSHLVKMCTFTDQTGGEILKCSLVIIWLINVSTSMCAALLEVNMNTELRDVSQLCALSWYWVNVPTCTTKDLQSKKQKDSDVSLNEIRERKVFMCIVHTLIET